MRSSDRQILEKMDFKNVFIIHRIYAILRESFQIVKSIFLQNLAFMWVTWRDPMFFYFWLIFVGESDGVVEIQIFKIFRIHKNKVWIQPMHSRVKINTSILALIMHGLLDYYNLMND